ncbi:spore germination protein [Ferviditalea candida]|uniref:Spore germination protein n=1 Tax=Ferviditalea candida TaxID=3108399 RepID=A0ABU5ZFB6_9BACL|nr:spore germination protein [Paenibacillaceae bacterium T2]
MPSFVVNVKILAVGPSSIVHIGDSLFLSPTSSAKTYAGSGSFNTGDLPMTNNALNGTNTWDPDAIDTSVGRVGPT